MIIIVTIIRNLFMVIYIFQHYTFIMIVFIRESIYFIASFLLKFLKKNYISHPVNYIYIYIKGQIYIFKVTNKQMKIRIVFFKLWLSLIYIYYGCEFIWNYIIMHLLWLCLYIKL